MTKDMQMQQEDVLVIGAGLAGCEAAWQLAQAGWRVRLQEAKPALKTPAQQSDWYAELVCSNSFRSKQPSNAVGLLKEEMSQLGSLVMQIAYASAVPAGDALAIDRQVFGAAITQAMQSHPNIHCETTCVTALPDNSRPCIIATGPLTHTALAEAIAACIGADDLYFYDALAPIVAAESLDSSRLFKASRYDKGDGADYLNCPLDEQTYTNLIHQLSTLPTYPNHPFETMRYFQGCLPIEIMASQGEQTLRFGPLKPIGLRDPRTEQRPYAVIQLRAEDRAGQAFNLVGFQTKLTQASQRQVLRSLPGMEQVEILRYGAMHRNTYIDAPKHLNEHMACHRAPWLHFAGQITGVEGYVESAAHGLLTGLLLADTLAQRRSSSTTSNRPVIAPPPTTALGALWHHVTAQDKTAARHEPQNVHWGLFSPLSVPLRKLDRKQARLLRARQDFTAWLQCHHPKAKHYWPIQSMPPSLEPDTDGDQCVASKAG